MSHVLAAAAAGQQAGLSPGGIGISLAATGLIAGLIIAMHRKKKSPRIIGWLALIVGIPLAGLLSGELGWLSGVSLFTIPVTLILVGYVGFVFLHDGFGKGKPHRWLQPIFGLLLPALLLTLGGSIGHGARDVMGTVNTQVGHAVDQTTGG
jgi:hypothetical protein